MMRWILLWLLWIGFVTPAAQAQVTQRERAAPRGIAPATSLTLTADITGGVNPRALATAFGFSVRHTYHDEPDEPLWSGLYVEGGVLLQPNPAWTQLSIYGQVLPLGFLRLRLQYDLYGYYGTNGALLSFADRRSTFGDSERDDLEDSEDEGFGQRILFQPTLRLRLGSWILRNQTDLAGYFIHDGAGPLLLELEYDTLVREDRDTILANRTQVLYELWKEGNRVFMLGAAYEMVYAFKARLTRQRIGALLFWIPTERLWIFDRPRVYVFAGVNVQDRNRDSEGFALFGVGFDIDL